MRATRRILLGVVLALVCVPVLTVQAVAATDSAWLARGGERHRRRTHECRRLTRWDRNTDSGLLVPAGRSMHIMRWVTSAEAPWLLVTARARAADSRPLAPGATSMAT
jgi:hypothetical protein